jgi:hypothetical protein
MEHEKKKAQFEPLVPLGIFLTFFGMIIVYATTIPADPIDKWVNFISGLAFLIWGTAWFIVGWRRRKKNT